MKIATIIAVLSKLLDWLQRWTERRHEAEIENEVRDDVARDARIKDLERAAEIDRAADAVLDRVRRADGDTTPPGDRGQYRD